MNVITGELLIASDAGSGHARDRAREVMVHAVGHEPGLYVEPMLVAEWERPRGFRRRRPVLDWDRARRG